MIIKALIISTMLSTDPIIIAMPPVKTEARKRNGKHNRDRRRGTGGLR